jgi:hypothetical protein
MCWTGIGSLGKDRSRIESWVGPTTPTTGARLGEILANDPASGLFCVANRDNELVIYDAASVRERKRFTSTTPVRFAQFLPARKQLLVLTADQKIHTTSMDDLHADSAVARAQ